MEEPRQPESLTSCRNVSNVAYYVRNQVELCIQNYMSLEVTAEYLEKTHQITKSVTHIVWEQLREENPVFFLHFDFRCKTALQMRKFNDMLTKQAVRMFEDGFIDICDASPSVKALLRREHPERVNLLETLASKSGASLMVPNANGPSQSQNPYDQQSQVLHPGSFSMPNPSGPSVVQSQNPYGQQNQVLNPASFAMPNPSGPSAAQWQIPNEQLNPQHLYASSLPLSDANGISVTQLPIPYDQQEQHLYTTNLPLPYANGPSVTQLPIPYDQQEQPLYATNLPLPYSNGPSMTQLPVPNDPQNQHHQDPLPTYNTPTFAPADTDDWMILEFDNLAVPLPLPPADTNPWPSSDDHPYTDTMPEDFSEFELGGDILAGLHPNEHEQHLSGQYQPHWQPQQQHVQGVEAQQTMQSGGRNNVLVNGESIGEQLCGNFDKHQWVDQQQAGGVQRHYPESEALNNPDTGYIGHNGFSDSYINSEAQLVTQPSEQPQHQNGHYQPQQNVPVETLQRGGRSNGLVNGESNDHQFCNNFDKTHSKRMCTRVFDQEQAGRVKRHHPESEALNNHDSGNETQTNPQSSPNARATTRSLKEWEQHESEH